ncbi:MAG: hypothetical protein J6K15_09300 [Lachnospiraceae bacterium]|nr:hypothetical protein [Lachnospiraceae bacterium]
MKNKIKCVGAVIFFLLLTACGPRENIGLIEFTDSNITATPIVVPTCTPTVTPTPDPAKQPTVAPTETVKPTENPDKLPTATPEPTATLAPTATPEPTSVPTITPMPTAEPTKKPEATPTAEPTRLPTPVPTEEPVLSTEEMIRSGWQKTVSVDEKYMIIFPELFRESKVEKTGQELIVSYFCREDEFVKFRVMCQMQISLEEKLNEILGLGGVLLSGSAEEKQVIYQWQENGMIYRGTFIEEMYSQALLGSVFGEQEQIIGVMQVSLSYPADKRTIYEASEYNYYIMENGEE